MKKTYVKFMMVVLLVATMVLGQPIQSNAMTIDEVLQVTKNSVEKVVESIDTLIDYIVDKFKDVEETDWYTKIVAKLVGLGVISGYDDGTFRPNNSVKVSEFVVMTLRAAGYTEITPNKDGAWYQNFVDKAIELRLIKSTDFKDFNRPITRGEMAYIITKMLGNERNEEFIPVLLAFQSRLTDYNEIPETQRAYVMACYSKGIIMGYPDGTFKAENTATRAESSTVIMKAVDPSSRNKVVEPSYDEVIGAYGREKGKELWLKWKGSLPDNANLPTNAKDFHHINPDIPVDLYEKPYNVGVEAHFGFFKPNVEVFPKLFDPRAAYRPNENELSAQFMCQDAKDIIMMMYNVDYQTFDKDKFFDDMKPYVNVGKQFEVNGRFDIKALYDGNNDWEQGQPKEAFLEELSKELEKIITDNKVTVKLSNIITDPSLIYKDEDSYMRVRLRVEYIYSSNKNTDSDINEVNTVDLEVVFANIVNAHPTREGLWEHHSKGLINIHVIN